MSVADAVRSAALRRSTGEWSFGAAAGVLAVHPELSVYLWTERSGRPY